MTDTAELEDRIGTLSEQNDELSDQVKALEEERDDLKRENEALAEKIDDATSLANDIVRELARR